MSTSMDVAYIGKLGTTSYFLLAVVLVFTAWCLLGNGGKSPGKLPPGPTGFPVIGVLPYLVGAGKNQYNVFNRWAREYGSVVSFRVMGQRLVILNDVDVVREALNKEVFSGRPRNFMNKVLNKDRGILGTEGPLWKEHRRFQLSTLRDFGMGKVKLENAIHEELRTLVSQIEGKGGKPFNFHVMIVSSVCNIIVSLLFGKRYDQNDPKLELFIRIISENIANIPTLNNTVSEMPWLRFLPGDVFKYWHTLGNSRILEDHIKQEIEEHKKSYQPEITRDFVDAFLHQMNENENNKDSTFSDIQLVKSCVHLFIAGMETTTTTLRWAILYMLRHQDIQKRLHEDIDREIGKGCLPTMKDRPRLPYIEATINETLRYCCLVPLALSHSNYEPVQINGYHIPKRCVIMPNIKKIHFDPKSWLNPEKFDPSRFLSDRGSDIIKHDAFMPFSIGRRACLGESLAKMELFIFFTGLLQRFTFLPERDGELPSIDPVLGIVLSPQAYKLRAVRRD